MEMFESPVAGLKGTCTQSESVPDIGTYHVPNARIYIPGRTVYTARDFPTAYAFV